MNKSWLAGLLLVGLMAGIGLYFRVDQPFLLNQEEAVRMGMQIWQNECAGKREGLTSWNEGEEFASLGIGHFIWHPKGAQGPFKEMFPALLAYLTKHGVALPAWLQQADGCPWQTRAEFLQAQNDPKMEELRQLLADHIHLQIGFMVQRLHTALPTLLKHASPDKKEKIRFQFYRLASTPNGIYALLDYLNFKGEGISFQESYNGQGWGLLQVLDRMRGASPGLSAVQEFSGAAKDVLGRRIQNSPKERGEQRWFKGWCNRIESYQRFSIL